MVHFTQHIAVEVEHMIFSLEKSLFEHIPEFKIGIVVYKNIVTGDSPNLLKGRLEYFQETVRTELDERPVDEYEGVREWREIFRKLGIDPKRYRPSHEALLKRISSGKDLPFIHSAADINNFFSLQYDMPVGIYDSRALTDYIKITRGQEEDAMEGLNGRLNNMEGKLAAIDSTGPFGSPIVDAGRTKTTMETTDAVQIFYLRPSLSVSEADQLLQASSSMFLQLHSGTARTYLLHRDVPEIDTHSE
ncbi:B3/B4 domain-containing protein [Salibacterium halotolerans]|uniref:B3/B4 domain-containing protein (DNA/RNA-binding domain of Phe-tRNA-synthetase) n=1 Tax=Salibacterium halotolerans TaxID=1884432 RepID=A0A1I5UK69_9BACI|nr:phenylalanine--tRNA ligase beta subunit-related protein [Salibacterium halotolerans]SFP95642.1 B3/B4 domain-containing protein (DNA/RNA-binding domain of Phe-tRNA-synthetase) [Salibacterium halotolerans]